jgi:Ca2+-binding RTX toxin-like protein
MAVTITVTSPNGSELPLQEWFLGADIVSPLNAQAGEYFLATSGTFLGGAIELRFKSSGADIVYSGIDEPIGGTLDSLEIFSVSLNQVVVTITGFSRLAELLHSHIVVQSESVDDFVVNNGVEYTGDDGADIFQSGFLSDKLDGGKGDDTLSGGFSEDVLSGGEGNDILRPGQGFNDVDGGDGFDTADYSDVDNGVGIIVDSAEESVTASDLTVGDEFNSIEKFIGTNYSDKFIDDGESRIFDGNGGNDEINGGAGDDWGIGGAGADIMDGGEGTDTVAFLSAGLGVTITLGAPGAQTTGSGGDAQGDKIKNFENIIGGDGNDKLTGNALNNRLFGTKGNDTLSGVAGNDILNGAEGKDTIDGGAGDDFIDGGAEADKLTGGADIDTVTYENSAAAVTVNLLTNVNKGGEAEGDTLFTVENIIGSDSGDTITGSATDNVIEGGAGADIIAGGGGKDTTSYEESSAGVQIDLSIGSTAQISTGDGNGDKLTGILNLAGSIHVDKLTGDASDNTIEGGDDADELDGLGGLDTLSYASSNGGVAIQLDVNGAGTGSGGHAQNDSYKNFENVLGSAFDDSLTGNAIVNKLTGGKGIDFFEGYGGADILDGGEGTDTASYENSDAGVTVNLTSNVNTGGHALGDKLAAIEDLYGSEFKDKLTGNTLSNSINGNSEDDYIDGGSGNDTLFGSQGLDTIFGSAGSDKIDGGQDADILDGGTEVDTLSYVSSGLVKVKLGEGSAAQAQSAATKVTVNGVADIELGGGDAEGDSVKNFENLIGSSFNDVLVGNSGNNQIEGGIGKDNIDGLKGNDVIFGGVGDDMIFGGDGDDLIEGGAGKDKLDGGLGKNTLSYANDTVGVEVDLLNGFVADGDAQDDIIVFSSFQNLRGGTGMDRLVGTAGANTLEGGSNEDLLIGSGGKDILDGGEAFDTAEFTGATKGVTVTLGAKGALTTVTAQAGAGSAAGSTIKNIEGLVGSAFNDKLTGNALDNSIIGGEGDDLILGDLGQDNLFGGNGIDTLSYVNSKAGVTVSINGANGTVGQGGDAHTDGIYGFENIIGSKFDDILSSIAAAQVNIIKGATGNDIIEGGAAGDTLFGETGSDTLSYATDNAGVVVVLKGSAAADVSGSTNAGNHAAGDVATGFENLRGGTGKDTLTGDNGANVIDGGSSNNDILDGAGGSDTVSYFSAAEEVFVKLGDNGAQTTGNGVTGESDTIQNFENIAGSAFGDTLQGNNLGNTLFGDGGNDTLRGGLGADKLDGGAGTDTADYSMLTANQAITVTLGTNGVAANVSSPAGSHAAGDTLINIEIVSGGAGKDKIIGNNLHNELNGGEGDDYLEGRGGNDVLDGGNGNDTASYVWLDLATGVLNINLAAGTNSYGDTFNSIENIIGSKSKDILRGNAGVNVLSGDGGDDTIDGGGGADILDGGSNKTSNLEGFAQVVGDTLDYTNYSDLDLVITLGDNGAKTVVTASGINASVANGEEIANFETVFASNGNDKLTGNSGDNALHGGHGDDLIEGGAGDDFLFGDNGINTVSYASAKAGVTVDLNNSQFQNTGGAGIDRILSFHNLIGSSKNDILSGNSLSNEISGGDGNDVIEGRQDGDILDGGLGIDTVSYENSQSNNQTVDLNLQDGVLKQTGGDAQDDILTGFENITGSGLIDKLIGDGNINVIKGLGGNDIVIGGNGADILDGGTEVDTLDYSADTNAITLKLGVNGAESTATGLSHGTGDKVKNFENVTGGSGNDMLSGNTFANNLFGGDGDDVIEGGLGDDFMDGGTGNDTLSYANAGISITVDLGDANPQNTGVGMDKIWSFDNLTGSVKNDILTGNGDKNRISGGAGNDDINGGGGQDILDGGAGDDVINGGSNEPDTASYESATAKVTVSLAVAGQQNTGGAGKDTLIDIERLIGSKFDDTLIGADFGTGCDLKGENGNDILVAAGDQITMAGGNGNDTFRFLDQTGNFNTIADFGNGLDKVQVSKTGFLIPANVAVNGAAANNFALEYFVSGSGAVADKAHAQFVYDTDTFNLYYDPDGAGVLGMHHLAEFTNGHNLVGSDFTLI